MLPRQAKYLVRTAGQGTSRSILHLSYQSFSLSLSLSLFSHSLSLSLSLREAGRRVANILLLTLNSVSLRLSVETHPTYAAYNGTSPDSWGERPRLHVSSLEKTAFGGARGLGLAGWKFCKFCHLAGESRTKAGANPGAHPPDKPPGAGDKGPSIAVGHTCIGAAQYRQQGTKGMRKHSEAW